MLFGHAASALAYLSRLVVIRVRLEYVLLHVAEVHVYGHVVVPRSCQKAKPLDKHSAQEDKRVAEQEGPETRRPRVSVNGEQILGARMVLVRHELLERVGASNVAAELLVAVRRGGEADVDLDGHCAALDGHLGPLVQANARQLAIVDILRHAVHAPAAAGGAAAPQHLVALVLPRHGVVDGLLGRDRLEGHEYVRVADGLARREHGQELGRAQVVVIGVELEIHEVADRVDVAPVGLHDALVAGRVIQRILVVLALVVLVRDEHRRIVVMIEYEHDALVARQYAHELAGDHAKAPLLLAVDHDLRVVDLDNVSLAAQIRRLVQHAERDGPLFAELTKGRQILLDLIVVVRMDGAALALGELDPFLEV